MRRGMYFTLDALFGAMLIGLALVVSSQYFISDATQPQVNYYSQDIINSLSTIKISEVNDTYVKYLISSGEITYLNNTVIEQIGEFYVLNKTSMAKNLSEIVSRKLVPEKFGFEILVNGDSIYYNSTISQKRDLVSSRRLISGIERARPIRGATSKVFLEGIRSKKHSSYLYFGGFIGQGNITHNLTDLPEDANITSIELELDIAGDFDIYINEQFCDALSPASNRTIADRWNITSCKTLIETGEHNKIELIFRDSLNNSFVGGGFLKVDYGTKLLSPYFEGYKIKYRFPGIEGIVNLYDAFYVPGTVEEMEIYLHFFANETSYLTIGNKIIHRWPGSDSEQFYTITNENLSTAAYANLADDFPLFSNNTVPVRFASYEAITKTLTGGNADVVLITDLSGSMKKATDSWEQGNSAPTCNNFYDNPDTRRTRSAVCLDQELVDIVMNFSGNRIWPIFMRENQVINYTWDAGSQQDVKDWINNYYNDQGKDKTCLACTINQAYDLLEHYSNASRKKFIVLMTDGCPTHCAYDAGHTCQSTSTEFYTSPECVGLCDQSGSCDASDIPSQCTDCTNNDGAVDNALFSAQRVVDDLNVTIYTIGFGPMDNCSLANGTLQQIADIGNGTYQHSKNVSILREIYRNISYEILEEVTQVSQSVTIRGNLSDSIFYPDSYIEVDYEPIAESAAFDEISISIEEDKFTSCNPTFDIPTGMRVTDAKVTSYSGEHWTYSLSINGNEIYNLTNYNLDFVRLGDPFFVYVPVNNIVNGTNTLSIETADSPNNLTGCSLNDTIIYTGLIKSSVSYADVLPITEGCSWTIDFEDGTSTTINVPEDYAGTKTCFYTSANPQGLYDKNDSIDSATYQLFNSLDYDNDGEIYVNIDELNLVVNAISVQKIPYPWGPAIAEVRVWK